MWEVAYLGKLRSLRLMGVYFCHELKAGDGFGGGVGRTIPPSRIERVNEWYVRTDSGR